MKSSQWIVLAAVGAAMVFGISFAVSYMPVFKAAAPKGSSSAKLTFADPQTTYPPQSETQVGDPPPAEFELGKSRSHDFWFKNANAQDLPVNLFWKNCQCTSIQLWIAPKEATDVPAEDQRADAPDGDGGSLAAAKIEASATKKELQEKESPVTIPAGAVGLVRLTWKSDPKVDRTGGKDLDVKLSIGDGAGIQDFRVHAIMIPPVRVSSDVIVGVFALEETPKTVQVPCFSSTRRAFPLEVRQLHSRWDADSNPFEIGKPVAMTTDDLAKLRKELDEQAKQRKEAPPPTVLAGYNIPITLRPRSKNDKTPLDLGPFRLHLQLKTEDADPVETTVKGWVRGDLGPIEDSRLPVQLGPFDRTKETSQSIELESGSKVTRLEVDRQRTPDFLTVDEKTLTEDTGLSGERKTWRITVKWVPSSGAVGPFPRDEEGYRDSAVYIRPVYDKPGAAAPACLCIPVTGKADTQ
ncbi:MAG TPA: hypothetical protein VMS17_28255 [Gemmataceae bacterium]|nr:hypothetical protein [Gemmataceae bacterium]